MIHLGLIIHFGIAPCSTSIVNKKESWIHDNVQEITGALFYSIKNYSLIFVSTLFIPKETTHVQPDRSALILVVIYVPQDAFQFALPSSCPLVENNL